MDIETLIENIDKYLIIDLRAPVEYNQGHIAHAYNVPLLDNESRQMIGTLYKQDKDQAYAEGLKIGMEVIPVIYTEVKKLMDQFPEKKVVFYCARGGMRSSSVVQMINIMKIEAFKLNGGYKQYRNFILDKTEVYIKWFNYLVVTGNTGSGKTDVLLELKAGDYPVIDLEGLAKHRGSVFGKVGIDQVINQRDFEDALFYQLQMYAMQNVKYIFVESESHRIGNIYLPKTLYDILKKSPHLLLNVSTTQRVAIIKNTYHPEQLDKESVKAIITNNNCFKTKLGHEWVQKMINLIETDDYDLFIEHMLVDYYDKLYATSQNTYQYDLKITEDVLSKVVTNLKEYYDQLS